MTPTDRMLEVAVRDGRGVGEKKRVSAGGTRVSKSED